MTQDREQMNEPLLFGVCRKWGLCVLSAIGGDIKNGINEYSDRLPGMMEAVVLLLS